MKNASTHRRLSGDYCAGFVRAAHRTVRRERVALIDPSAPKTDAAATHARPQEWVVTCGDFYTHSICHHDSSGTCCVGFNVEDCCAPARHTAPLAPSRSH